MRANANTMAPVRPTRFVERRANVISVVVLILVVSAIYTARLGLQPLVGEETRWATAAREMLATGDWIVPRQQGHVFPERPPMTMWVMAIAGSVRGDVDPIAIRLPSAIAVVLTTLLIFSYVRAVSSTFAATTAAFAYASMGQVMQIGRQGESEALFALLVGASLLIWHLGYMRAWRPVAVWTCGFALAALAALVKGPQAPVYFVAITAAYLAMRRDWRYLFHWSFAAGAAVFAAILAAWQIPFYLATDADAVIATWSGLAGDRFHLSGVLSHAVMYPLETFVCLLPWSPILVALFHRETRRLLQDQRSVTTFLFTALLVAYPTVWLAAGARGRYFMPLYPIVAVLVGLLVERCAFASSGSYPRRAWHQFLLLCGAIVVGNGLVVGAANLLFNGLATRLYQPRWFAFAFASFAAGTGYMLWKCYRHTNKFQSNFAVAAIALMMGVETVGFLVNVNVARWNNPVADVTSLKNQLPPGTNLVSFSPIEHRFAYYYRDPIAELDWPQSGAELPPNVDYFCFMRQPGDTPESRAAGRGRTWYTTPGTLPFAWEEVASICVERYVYDDHPRTVVLGRVVRPMRETVSDVTKPQDRTALRDAPTTSDQAASYATRSAGTDSARDTASNTVSTDKSRMQR